MQIKERLIATLVRTVYQLKAFSSVSAFSVNALEKSFGHNEAWKYPEFTLPNGVTVRLTGQIDRIDTLRRDNRTFVLIMDYKSGRKALTLQDVYDGLSRS